MPDHPRWRRYLRFWRPDVSSDVDDEIAFHLEEQVDDLVARGRSPEAARAEALARLGNLDRLKAVCRTIALDQESDMRRAEWWEEVKQDISYATRLMRAAPTMTAAICVTIALGIGATTSIFSVVNAVLLRPLPFTDAERIVVLRERIGENHGSVAVGVYNDWSTQARSFSAMALAQGATYNLTDGEPARYGGARVTNDFFKVAHMRPLLGRYFAPDETADSRVVVISQDLWQSHFAADSTIIGRTIALNGDPHVVIGVTPADFSLTQFDARLWTLMTPTPQQRANYGSHVSQVYALLGPGVSLASAEADLERVTAGIRQRQPDAMRDRGSRIFSYREWRIGSYDTQLWVLLGAVSFVLLIACVNVASLLLARATARRKEIAIRGALGGSRGRLLRQLLTESVILSAIGGLMGMAMAAVGVRFLVRMGPPDLPRLTQAGLQLDVVAFAALLTVACGIAFGLAPALRATRVDLQSALRTGLRGSRGTIGDRTRSALIVSEIAVVLVLLVSASLFLRSAHRLQQVEVGFEPGDVSIMRVALPTGRYDSAAVIQATFARILDEVRAIPGVERAGAGTRVPMLGTSFDFGLHVESKIERGQAFFGHMRIVTPGYFETLGIPVRRGRAFLESDNATSPAVVVVNETFARRSFGDENPIGQRVSGWTAQSNVHEWREIVGVVADIRAFGRENDVPPEVYTPYTQARQSWWNSHQRNMTIVAKATPGVVVVPAMRAALKRIDPQLPAFAVQTMDDVVATTTASRRFNTMLLTLLGATGLILAAIGVYGVIAFFVGQRTHEIGVRVALGASTGSVVNLVLRQAVALAAAGIAIGGLSAAWATKVLASMLYQVPARDVMSFAAGAGVILVVAIGASIIPARRAAKVDPVTVLTGG